jgi:hypothetical protein
VAARGRDVHAAVRVVDGQREALQRQMAELDAQRQRDASLGQ